MVAYNGYYWLYEHVYIDSIFFNYEEMFLGDKFSMNVKKNKEVDLPKNGPFYKQQLLDKFDQTTY